MGVFQRAARGGERFQGIIKHCLDVVPELIALLNDSTPTSNPVAYWGGDYAIGDVAMVLISEIVHVPWLDLVPTATVERIETIGFGVYWEYVRESDSNRLTLQSNCDRWFTDNEDDLVWHSLPSSPQRGRLGLPKENEP